MIDKITPMFETILRYKYVPLDDSFKIAADYKDGSLCIIKDGTIKFSHPKDFNDPFDCYPEVDVDAITQSKAKDKEFFKTLRKEHNLSPAKFIQEKSKILANLRNDFYSKRSDVFNNRIGVCSLSRNPLNLLMWAHYASSHTGFVVEFTTTYQQDFERNIDCLLPYPVEYKKEKPTITHHESIKPNHEETFFTKGEDWKYEQEERVIDTIRGAGIHPYNRKQILKSVIAGMRMSDEDFATLKNTVATVNQELGIHVTVHKAEAVKGKFALYVPDRDDLNIHSTP